jgi:1-acyl-sn-glycerol-3-phosphate acyltransferase
MAEAATPAIEFHKPRVVNRLFYRVMTGLLRPFILRYFHLQPVNPSVVPAKGAGIILANHTNLFDVIWVYAMLRRPVYFAANEDLFRKRALGTLIRWFGAFPKRKAASDMAAVRSIFGIIAKGGLIGVYPEGVRTWDGKNSPLYGGIAKLIRKLEVPVYICRVEGGYLFYPRWARRWRPIPVKGVFSRLYEPSQIPQDDDRILADISAAIRTTDFELPIDAAHFRRSGMAVNITRVLYRCPSCGTLEGLKIVRPHSTNRVECSSCFSSWEVNAACRLSPTDENGKDEGAWTSLPDYYARIRDLPLLPIRTEIRIGLVPGEKLYLISRPRFLMKQEVFPNLRVFAFGRAFLTDRRLIFRTRIGIPLDAPLRGLAALSVDPGDRLHFTFDGKLYRIPFRNESALKWYDTIHRFKDDEKSHREARGNGAAGA